MAKYEIRNILVIKIASKLVMLKVFDKLHYNDQINTTERVKRPLDDPQKPRMGTFVGVITLEFLYSVTVLMIFDVFHFWPLQ